MTEYERLELFFKNNGPKDGPVSITYDGGLGSLNYQPQSGQSGTHVISWMSYINLSRTERQRQVRFYLKNYPNSVADAEISQNPSPLILMMGNYIECSEGSLENGGLHDIWNYDSQYYHDNGRSDRNIEMRLNPYKYGTNGGEVWLCFLTNGNVIDVSINNERDKENLPLVITDDSEHHTVDLIRHTKVYWKHVYDDELFVNQNPVSHQIYPILPTTVAQNQSGNTEHSYYFKDGITYSGILNNLYDSVNQQNPLCIHSRITTSASQQHEGTLLPIDVNNSQIFYPDYAPPLSEQVQFHYLNRSAATDYGYRNGLVMFFVGVRINNLQEEENGEPVQYIEDDIYVKVAVGGYNTPTFSQPKAECIRVSFNIDPNPPIVTEYISASKGAFNYDATDVNNPQSYIMETSVTAGDNWESNAI